MLQWYGDVSDLVIEIKKTINFTNTLYGQSKKL